MDEPLDFTRVLSVPIKIRRREHGTTAMEKNNILCSSVER